MRKMDVSEISPRPQLQVIFRATRFSMPIDVKCPVCGKQLSVFVQVDRGEKTLDVLGHEAPLCQNKERYAEPAFLDRVDEEVQKCFDGG